MKPLLKLVVILLLAQTTTAQSLDYLSVRKKNGRVLKNIYAGGSILMQTKDGSYLQGPVEAIRNDSLYVMLYDVRVYATIWGSRVRDTVSRTLIGVNHKDIARIHLSKRSSFAQRATGPLLMLGGGGYFAVNVLNGAFFNQPITDKRNLKTLGIAAGAFGLGYLIQKLFSTDGFSKKKHQIVYVDL